VQPEPLATAVLFTTFAALVIASVVFSRSLERTGIPVALVFLAIGMLAGSEGIGGIAFDDYEFAFRIGTAALVLILFDGGLNTPSDSVRRVLAPIDFLARRRYFLDAIYGALYRGFLLGFSRLVGFIDRYLVDGCLNAASAWTLRAGDALRHIQSGQAQDYVYGVTFGVLLLLVWAQWWRSP